MATTNRDIKYINRDFSDFRSRLIEYARTYFPQTYNDFTPSSVGMMFMEQASYVGDVLSFYLDNQFQETFTQYAQQTNNVFELAYMFGYKPKTTGVAQTTVDVYQQLPSIDDGTGNYVPDYSFAITVGENTTVTSQNGSSFLIQDKIDFSVSSSLDPTEVTVYQIAGNIPQYFLLKKTRKAISAIIKSSQFTFGSPQQFQTININDSNIVKILDITDSDGNKWYEVDHLGQEMVFDTVKNSNIYDPNVNGDTPYLLRLRKVARRFATRFTSLSNLQIQFGAGNPLDVTEEITPNADNVGIGLPFEQDKLTVAYSPTNFLFTGTYGVSPANTTLTVRYLVGGGVASNIEANSLVNLNTNNTKFNNVIPLANTTLANIIFSSLASNNPVAASGGRGGDTLEEIRQNTLALIASQKRSVTADDYLVRALSMPTDYGTVSKAYIEQPKLTDNQVSTIETLNLYVLSLNPQGQLSVATDDLKNNLRTYLSQYRMIGDNIEVRDAFIINIAVDFEIIVLPEYNNNEVILACITALQDYFNLSNWQINQPIFLRDLYVLLDKIKGVQTVKNISLSNKAGTTSGYSQYAYDIVGATQNQVIYPSLDPSIFEVKYPATDIKGKVVPL
jgi:hypothetical protein